MNHDLESIWKKAVLSFEGRRKIQIEHNMIGWTGCSRCAESALYCQFAEKKSQYTFRSVVCKFCHLTTQ